MKIILLLTAAIALSACSTFRRGPKSSARMYEGDSSPSIKLYEEKPGWPVGN